MNKRREDIFQKLSKCGFDEWLLKQGMYLNSFPNGKLKINYIVTDNPYVGAFEQATICGKKISDYDIPIVTIQSILENPDMHISVKELIINNIDMFV
tara:strand:+ start:256 stop:546 length:291 start_codon:yes stop_codon:yes gene_type:complete